MFTNRELQFDLNGRWKFNPDPYMRCRQQRWWLGEGDDHGFFPCFNLEGLWEIEVPGTWKCQFEELKWYDGHANYVREFELPEIPADQLAFLVFDSVVYRCDVYLNGEAVGNHECGYSPFQLEVTGRLRRHNRLFVLVENLMRPDRVPGVRCDWNNDGGIVGGVKLIFVPKTFLENFRVSTRLADGNAQVKFELFARSAEGKESLPVTVRIPELGAEQRVEVSTRHSASAVFEWHSGEIELWSPEHPRLYRVEFEAGGETLSDEIGFREIRTEGRRILLNGKPIRLYGVAVHSEFPGTGRTATEEGVKRMLVEARELGCNFLRCAHYPYQELFGRMMDRAGMLWWEEVPVYWLPEVHTEPQCTLALTMLREMIQRDWNRAGLIFWSLSNECAGDKSGTSLEEGNYPYWVKAAKLVRELDDSRLISSADSGHRRIADRNGWTPADGDCFDRDIHHQEWSPGHPDAFYDLLDVLGANLYVCRPGDNPEAERKWAAMMMRFNKPLMITEFGSMSTTEAHPDKPEDVCGHPKYHETILREAYRAFHELPEITGYVPWALADIRVPMHWRWYNRGSGTFAYGLTDNNFNHKHVFEVVKEEIASLRQHFGDEIK